jgi:hypothetical protein
MATASYTLITTYSDGHPLITGTRDIDNATPDALIVDILYEWYNDGQGDNLLLHGLGDFVREHWDAFVEYLDGGEEEEAEGEDAEGEDTEGEKEEDAAVERKAQRKVDVELIALEKEMLELYESGGFERVDLADDVARDPVKFGEWMVADFARREAAAASAAEAFKQDVLNMPLAYANADCDKHILKRLYSWLEDYAPSRLDEFLDALANAGMDPVVVVKNPDPRLSTLLQLASRR